ncbi:MAG: glycosyltransferase [Methanobacteriaceae archaeon]|nr:glycosyltransferase [Methanobacteriaceae archaeon]
MRIPKRIRQTEQFDKIRSIKHDVNESGTVIKQKLKKKVKEKLRKKRKLTIEEMNLIDSKIRTDNQNNIITNYSKKSPLVSIIIINHNGKVHLKRLLSVIDSTISYPNYEIIIVDNNSSDNSMDIIKSYTNLPIRIIHNDSNMSFSYANNQAAKIAKGEYLLFLNNDIEPLNGWLNHMMDTMNNYDDVGAVGAKLIYPDCSPSKINKEKSYTIQHEGIIFKESEGFIKPFNKNNSVDYETKKEESTIPIIAITAATLLVEKKKFNEVNGFSLEYNYGYEDVDLCLKLYKKGYMNYYTPKAILYHYEFGTQEKTNNKKIIKQRTNNKEVFINKWNKWLRKELINDKLNHKHIFTDKSLTIGFVVTQCDSDTCAGDYFTALTLARQLKKFNYNIKYIPQKNNEKSWYDLDDDIDVLVSLLDRYNLEKIRSNNGLLIKIAWARNWFERWIKHPNFNKYDIILVSSKSAGNYIKKETGRNSILFPLATDPEIFNKNVKFNKDYESDYCFTGSYWNVPREIISLLDPEKINYKFSLFGSGWGNINHLNKYSKGFIDYKHMPVIYASTKIVVDDANHVTKEYGSVNSRVFDAIASGKIVISNGEIGSHDIFNDLLPVYHNSKELNDLIEYYMTNKESYKNTVKKLQDIVLNNHTYLHRAKKLLDLITEYYNKESIAIKIPVPSWKQVYEWGDYYTAQGLKEELDSEGYNTKIQILPEWHDNTDVLCDTVIVLRGLSMYKPKKQHFNIMWNISHPHEVSIKEYNLYDHVFIASKPWSQKIDEKTKTTVECMFQCTNKNRFYKEYDDNYNHELLFVGNSRNVHRKIIKDLLPTTHDLAVYGAGWNRIINKKYVIADHINNNQLRYAYSSCEILLNDHWKDMREEGFISNRIFDGLACGALIISDNVTGLHELFPNVLTYDTKEELKIIIDKELNKEHDINSNIINDHTYKQRAKQIINCIK